jgi:hypothetical protein
MDEGCNPIGATSHMEKKKEKKNLVELKAMVYARDF